MVAADDEQMLTTDDHQANEKLSCIKPHFQGDVSHSASVFVSAGICCVEKNTVYNLRVIVFN